MRQFLAKVPPRDQPGAIWTTVSTSLLRIDRRDTSIGLIMKYTHLFAPLLFAPWAIGCAGDPASDLSIVSIEVTQAVQTPTNTVGLVAQRSVAVRVMLDTGSSNSIDNVSGILSVTVDGTQITPVGGIAAVNQPITVPPTPNRNNEDNSLYFELAAPTGIPASSDVDFLVAVAGNGQPGKFTRSWRALTKPLRSCTIWCKSGIGTVNGVGARHGG